MELLKVVLIKLFLGVPRAWVCEGLVGEHRQTVDILLQTQDV